MTRQKGKHGPSERRRGEPAGTPAPPRTHYDTLGVSARATPDQIRSAYRRAAKLHHPDVNSGPGAQARFADIAAAYEVLSDASRRRDYDAALRDAAAGRLETGHYSWTNVAGTGESRGSEAGRSDLDEMYETFFGRHKAAE